MLVLDKHEPTLFETTKFFPQFDRMLGIDWGHHGGFFWNEGDILCSRRMPMRVDDTVDIVKVWELLVNEIRPTIAYGEKVDPIPNQSAVATGTFQREIGRVEGLLAALGTPLTLVRPSEWIKAFTDKSKGDFTILSKRGQNAGKLVPSTTAWKKYLLSVAEKLHPHKIITLETADACLIWRFAQDNHGIRVRKIDPPKFSR